MPSKTRLSVSLPAALVAVFIAGCATCGSDRMHWSVDPIGPAQGPASLNYLSRQITGLLQAHVRYPLEACQAGLEGTPAVKVHIAASGEIKDVALSKSSGHALLDRALLDGWVKARDSGTRLDVPADLLNGAPGIEWTSSLTFNKP